MKIYCNRSTKSALSQCIGKDLWIRIRINSYPEVRFFEGEEAWFMPVDMPAENEYEGPIILCRWDHISHEKKRAILNGYDDILIYDNQFDIINPVEALTTEELLTPEFVQWG